MFPRKDVFTAAEGVFGRGAEGLGDMIEKLLRDHGEPTAYITGREAGGAFVIGVRYGSGTLHHQIRGRPAGPIGPGLRSASTSAPMRARLFRAGLQSPRHPEHLPSLFRRRRAMPMSSAASTASYLRRGDIVLIPVRLGVGARLGITRGYIALQRAQSLGSVLTRA